jgi:hypothetical protein
MPVPAPCRPIEAGIADLKRQREEAWSDVKQAIADGDIRAKFAAAARAAALTRRIVAEQQRLEKCVADNGGPAPLAATFTGQGVIEGVNSSLAATNFNLSLGLWFSALRDQVVITYFPVQELDPVEVEGPFGPVSIVITVEMRGGGRGQYRRSTGSMTVPLTLHFDVDRDFPGYNEDMSLRLSLSTDHPDGSPLDAAGRVVLAGSGYFEADPSGFGLNNPLIGTEAAVTCTGRISPHP